MSDSSFPINVPPIPIPLISPDEGVPSIPDFQPYSYGSIGESSTGYDISPSRPNQIGYQQEAARLPLTLYKVDDDNVGITTGTVNEKVIPNQENIEISVSTFVYIKIELTVSKEIDTVSIHVSGNTQGLDSTDSIAYASIGKVTVEGGKITQVDAYTSGSMGYIYGGSDYHYIIAAK